METTQSRVCVWEDLSYTDALFMLYAESTNEDIASKVSELLSLNLSTEDQRERKRSFIVRDLFYYTVLFARKEQLNAEQLSALFTITKTIHKTCTSTPYDNSRHCYQLLKDLLVCHSVHWPPYSIQLYSLNQVGKIMDYLLQTYFRHFKLYKYAFTKRVLLNLKISYEGLEDTPQPSESQLIQGDQGAQGSSTEEQVLKDVEETEDDKELHEDNKEQETLTPEQQEIKEMITQTLNDHMKKLKLTVDKELADSNSRLSEKLGALENIAMDPKEKKRK